MPHFRNTVLKALSPEDIQRMHLESITFQVGYECETLGAPTSHVHFVERGMASVTTMFKNGTEVEVGMFGNESVVGISALMGSLENLNRTYIQIAGDGFRCSIANASREFQRGALFQTLSLRSVQAQLAQAMQTAGCNATHEAEQRLARWLLTCRDRTGSSNLPLSQTFLADMIGTRRTTVTMVALRLKEAGLISYSRGLLRILDGPGLEQKACECYRVIRDYLVDPNKFSHPDAANL